MGESSPRTPLGISKFILLFLYFLQFVILGMPPYAASPLKSIYKASGVLSWVETEKDWEYMVNNIINFAYSTFLLTAPLVGFVSDKLGPRITSVFGALFVTLGYALMYFVPSVYVYYLASAFFGMSLSCNMNSRVGAAMWFPESSGFVLSIVGSAPDLGLLVVYILSVLSARFSVHITLPVHILLCAIVTVSCVPLFPSKYESLQPVKDESCGVKDDEERDIMVWSSRSWTLSQQILSVPFFLTALTYSSFFFIRANYLLFNEKIYTYFLGADKAQHIMSIYNSSLAGSFCLGYIWGNVVDKFGFIPMLLGLSTTAFFLYITISTTSLLLNYFSIFLFALLFSFVSGSSYTTISELYGYSRIGLLVGLQSVFGGCVQLYLGPLWQDYVVNKLQSNFLRANMIMKYWSVSLWLVIGLVYLFNKAKRVPLSSLVRREPLPNV